MQKLPSHDSVPTVFAFAPLILFQATLKSWRMLGISPGQMVGLET
jgi:hypothetical protein